MESFEIIGPSEMAQVEGGGWLIVGGVILVGLGLAGAYVAIKGTSDFIDAYQEKQSSDSADPK